MRKGRFAGFIMAAQDATDPRLRAENRVPVVLAVSAPALVAAVAAVAPTYAIGSAIGAALVSWIALLGMVRRNERSQANASAADRERGARFLTEFERGGGGWFWETNADGLITYVSPELATTLEKDPSELVGGRFEDMLLMESEASSDGKAPTLAFHLSARFPFAGVGVSPTGRSDLSWSLSGRPVFDEVGRFLGFRGLGVPLNDEQRTAVNSNRVAAVDSLTGLPNRARMREMLDEALANADSRREGCALLLIDLDRFKHVNDTLGHPIGDVLLQEVGKRMVAVIGSEGQIGRLGGDEFEAVLPGIDEEGRLEALAERMIAKVSAPYTLRGHTVTIGASVGIAISRPGKTLADALIKEADLALYAAKNAGRGTSRFFEPEMHVEESERQILENDLRSAVGKGQLRLVFQPVVSAATEDLAGFEALLRWIHPTRGPLAPGQFLDIAEASGLIGGIGEWVIRSACAEAAKWPSHLHLAINISRNQLELPGLASTIASALATAQIDPDRLELDLGEAAFHGASAEICSTLASLKTLGVKLALDDFGTGVSSLTSLSSANLDRVKVHPSLIRSAGGQGGRAEVLLSSVIALAPTLGIRITAEGAETLDDLALIRKLGCSDIQGFLFGRPMNADEALELAAQSAPVNAREALESRPPRQSLIRRASMLWRGGTFSVRLRNISGEGAMIESPQDIEKGASVSLDLSGGVQLDAEVRWSQDGRIGLKFAEAFDLQQLGKAGTASGGILRPDYLKSETSPNSPWAARQDRLTIKDVRTK